MRASSVVNIQNLHFRREQKVIFSGLDLSIHQGSVVAIMGPSGCGKTTLLGLIGGQLQADQGRVELMGQDLKSLSRRQLNQLRRRIGYLFQGGALFTDFNVYENVAFPLREHTRLPNDMIRDLVLAMLEAVGLRGAEKLQIDQLSGGMARRVALARAIIMGPELMLYDEPFAGQDPIGRGVLIKLIRELNQTLGLTSVLVSHNVAEAEQIADYVYILWEGKIMGQGTPAEILATTSPQVHQFIRGLPDGGGVSFQYPAKNYQEELGL